VTSSRRSAEVTTAEEGRAFRGGTILGPERDDPVEIVPYDTAWPSRFAAWRARIATALGDPALRIEHVGSTAVPGLAAKPVIDIQLSVADVSDEAAYVPAIEALGFGLRYRHRGHGWRYFRPPPGLPRQTQVHVCSAGGEWQRAHLLFRDYLRAHPAEADAYGAVKREAATRHPRDRIAYTDAKGTFILPALERAEAWARVSGWSADPGAAPPRGTLPAGD